MPGFELPKETVPMNDNWTPQKRRIAVDTRTDTERDEAREMRRRGVRRANERAKAAAARAERMGGDDA